MRQDLLQTLDEFSVSAVHAVRKHDECFLWIDSYFALLVSSQPHFPLSKASLVLCFFRPLQGDTRIAWSLTQMFCVQPTKGLGVTIGQKRIRIQRGLCKPDSQGAQTPVQVQKFGPNCRIQQIHRGRMNQMTIHTLGKYYQPNSLSLSNS